LEKLKEKRRIGFARPRGLKNRCHLDSTCVKRPNQTRGNLKMGGLRGGGALALEVGSQEGKEIKNARSEVRSR